MPTATEWAHAVLTAALQRAAAGPFDPDGTLTEGARAGVRAVLEQAEEDGPAHDWDAMSEADWASFAADDWRPHKLLRGPRKGQQVWKNERTGAISDVDPRQKAKEREEAVSGRKKKAEEAAQALVAAAKEKAKEKERGKSAVGEMIRGERPATAVAVRAAGQRLLAMTRAELVALKRQLQVKGGWGKKQKLVQAILAQALAGVAGPKKTAAAPARAGAARRVVADDRSADLAALTFLQLKDMASRNNLGTLGTKAQLIDRLTRAGFGKQAQAQEAARKKAAADEAARVANEPKFERGQPIDLGRLRARLARVPDSPLLPGMHSERLQAEMTRILDEAAADHGEQKVHGMTSPEKMQGVTVGHVKVSWPEGHKGTASALLAIAQQDYPPPLWNATKQVVITSQANGGDEYWQRKYKDFTTSAATGSDGTVCVYGGGHLGRGTFAHESGHNLATAIWGETNPPPASAYAQAQKTEKPVSEYGANSPAEDFAEACKMYADTKTLGLGLSGHDTLRRDFPKKYAALDDIMTGRVRPSPEDVTEFD